MSPSKLVLLVAAALMAVASGQSNNNWDFFLFVQEWPGSWSSSPPACVSGFTIHGLWPERNDGSYPQFCNGSAWDVNALAPIRSQLDCAWPSDTGDAATFWQHEWEKHGTCAQTDASVPTQLSFFQAGIRLSSRYALHDILSGAGIKPTSSKKYTVGELRAAVQKGAGVNSIWQCQKGKIDQVIICVTKGLVAQDCPSTTTHENTCGSDSSEVEYPPLR